MADAAASPTLSFLRLLSVHGDAAPPPADGPQWEALAQFGRDQRLRPLFHHLSRKHGWPPPNDIAEEWERSHRRNAMRSLQQKAELLRIAVWLGDAGIKAIALKGGAFIWRGWIEPAARPMRDLDILVPEADAERAQKTLISKGFAMQGTGERTSQNKHLPGLYAPGTGVLVEVHRRVMDAPSAKWKERDALLVADMLSRGQTFATSDGKFGISADCDTLLHVIAHAALDHQYNNGPLVLLDLELLLDKGEVDWDAFWQTAERAGLIRAAQLTLSLALWVMPHLSVEWREHAPANLDSKAVMAAAHLLCLPEAKRTDLGVLGRIMRYKWSEQPGILLDRLTLPRNQAASTNEARSGLRDRMATIGGKAGRAHIRQSLNVAKWLRG